MRPRNHGRGSRAASTAAARAWAGAGLVALAVATACASVPPVAPPQPASTVGATGMPLPSAVSSAAPAPVASASGSAQAPSPGAPGGGATPSSAVAQGHRGLVLPPDLADLEHMCALLTSCDKLPIPPSLIPSDFSSCVTKMASELSSASAVGFSLLMRECGLQSNSCASLRSCALRGANPEACAGRGKQGVVGFCDVDGRALACWHEQVLAVRDCPRGGEQCIVLGGQASCTLGPCPASIVEGDKPRCSTSGRHLLHCEKGKLASLDCAAFGLQCSTARDAAAGCATAAPACDPASKRCDGSTAVGCYDGHEVRVDCGAAGMTCSSTPGSMPVGACFSTAPPPGEACDLADRAKCDGPNVKYCYAGKPRVYPCKALGFNRCDATSAGVRCAP